MNYTYLPPSTSPYTSSPVIIMTTPPTSHKTHNLASNPKVSLLVHDWVSHRPPTLAQERSSSPTQSRSGASGRGTGSLAELLLGINTASLSRISTTINGDARILEPGSEEDRWYRRMHLENNTFSGPGEEPLGTSPGGGGLWAEQQQTANDDEREGDGGARCYVEGEEARVVVVRIRDGRIADWKGAVRDWVVRDVENGVDGAGGV